MKNKYEISLDLELDKKLTEMAFKYNVDRAEVIRKALAFWNMFDEKMESTDKIAIVDKDLKVKFLVMR
jgi:hypothetical protein